MTANVKGAPVPLQLDKKRHLSFDLNAFIELEEKFGSIQDALDALQKLDPGRRAQKGKKRQDLKTFRTFLWAGLVHEDDALTEKEVGKLINLETLDDVADAILGAVNAALPEVEEDDIKNSQNPA